MKNINKKKQKLRLEQFSIREEPSFVNFIFYYESTR